MLPKDPFILFSFTNTQLRDKFSNLDDFCEYYDISIEELTTKLQSIGYSYDISTNQFKK